MPFEQGGEKPDKSGRKKGAGNKRLTERAAEALLKCKGRTPLDVMILAMHHYADAEEWDKAADMASKAAPYVHRKMPQAIDNNVNVTTVRQEWLENIRDRQRQHEQPNAE